MIDADWDMDDFADTECFAKIGEPPRDYYLAQRSAPSLVDKILRTLKSLVVLNEVAPLTLADGTFHNGANCMPRGGKENVAIWNVRAS
jgi:hypothetical protein